MTESRWGSAHPFQRRGPAYMAVGSTYRSWPQYAVVVQHLSLLLGTPLGPRAILVNHV